MDTNSDYLPPVSRLLELGECKWGKDWLNYSSLGITSEHIPALIRLATDNHYLNDSSEGNEAWAPIHAWRALGQLKATEAVDALIGLLRRIDENDEDCFNLTEEAQDLYSEYYDYYYSILEQSKLF